MNLQKQIDDMRYEEECLRMYMLRVNDADELNRLAGDLAHVIRQREELFRVHAQELLPDAERARNGRAGRVKAVEEGKHKPRRPNAAGITVDAPQVKAAYIAQRKAKSRNTHNAAAGVVAKKFDFTSGQVKREAERGAWFTK